MSYVTISSSLFASGILKCANEYQHDWFFRSIQENDDDQLVGFFLPDGRFYVHEIHLEYCSMDADAQVNYMNGGKDEV